MSVREEFIMEGTNSKELPLLLSLWTTTASYHHQKCLATEEGFGTTSRACNTGLRVYEGARLMAEFFASDVFANSKIYDSLFNERETEMTNIVELGCGCALAGLTLANVAARRRRRSSQSEKVPSSRVNLLLTDASEECVAMVQNTIGDMNTNQEESLAAQSIYAHSAPFWWSVENATSLRSAASWNTLFSTNMITTIAAEVDLVIGSDLLYFMVDVDVLLSTCRALLHSSNLQSEATTNKKSRLQCCVLAHFMRLTNGQQRLADAARQRHGFHIAQVHAADLFVPHYQDVEETKKSKDGAEELRRRGWGSLELCLLVPRDDTAEASELSSSSIEERDVLAIAEAIGISASVLRCYPTPSVPEEESQLQVAFDLF